MTALWKHNWKICSLCDSHNLFLFFFFAHASFLNDRSLRNLLTQFLPLRACRWIYSNADQFKRAHRRKHPTASLFLSLSTSLALFCHSSYTTLLYDDLRRHGKGQGQWPWYTILEFVYKCPGWRPFEDINGLINPVARKMRAPSHTPFQKRQVTHEMLHQGQGLLRHQGGYPLYGRVRVTYYKSHFLSVCKKMNFSRVKKSKLNKSRITASRTHFTFAGKRKVITRRKRDKSVEKKFVENASRKFFRANIAESYVTLLSPLITRDSADRGSWGKWKMFTGQLV